MTQSGVFKMGFSPFENGLDGMMFSVIPVIVGIGFIAVFGFMIAQAVKGGREWRGNNRSPVLTVPARVAAKRFSVDGHHAHHQHHIPDDPGHGMGTHTHTTSTTYYAAFEVESGDRMEFRLPGKEYGLLAEGDAGRLTFQGTRYLGFERDRL